MLITNILIPINLMKKELSPHEVVKIYKKHGIKITVKEAEHILRIKMKIDHGYKLIIR
jgi:hypothetical protein